jgi:membrane associated rhomboid family serine protease
MRKIIRELKYFLYKDFIPVSKGLMLLGGVFFILSYLYDPLYSLVALNPLTFSRYPWTLLTYPLANLGILPILFSFLWLWFFGGSLERSWGSQTYGFFFFLVTLVTGLAMMLVSRFIALIPLTIAGFWLPLTAVTWAWADIHRGQELLLWGLIPIKAEWIAGFEALLTFLTYFKLHWSLGLASVSGIAVVYLFRGNGPFARGLRYWLWRKGFSGKSLTGRFRKKKRRLRVVE